MKLTVLERLMALSILPAEGDFTTLKIVRELREQLSFSEEEHAKLQFVVDENGTKWKAEAAEEKEFLFPGKAFSLIADALNKLDENKQLTENHCSLYEKFCIR